MQNTAIPSSPAETSSRFAGPSGSTSSVVSKGPQMAPAVPPAAMKPNSRRACRLVKMSVMKLQKTDTTNRLKTLVQMKNARATQAWVMPDLNSTKNSSRLTMKNP